MPNPAIAGCDIPGRISWDHPPGRASFGFVDTMVLGSKSAPTRCAVLRSQFNQRLENKQRLSREEAVKLATQAFWQEQEGEPLWVVPMGDESVFARHCGLLAALERARAAGRTPLLVDNSQDRVIDIFFSYSRTQCLEAKKMLIDERQGLAREAVLERARAQLVKALRFGQTFYIRLANSACDFVGRYTGENTLPMALFDGRQVAALNREFGSAYGSGPVGMEACFPDPGTGGAGETAHVGTNLWGAGSRSPFAAVLREEDTDRGCFVPRRGFEVVVCTHLGVDEFAGFLRGKLPMELLQPIIAIQQEGGDAAESGASCKPGVEELRRAVEESCAEAVRCNTKEARETLEVALRSLLVEVGSREMDNTDKAQLDAALSPHAASFKSALLRPLNACDAHRGFAALPRLTERARCMLAAAPAKGVTTLLQDALVSDIVVCGDLTALESVQSVLEFLVSGKGRLRHREAEAAADAAVADAAGSKVELPSAHQEACRAAILRSKKRCEAIRAWRRAQQLKAKHGLVCVRHEGSNVAINEAFDVCAAIDPNLQPA